MTANDLVIPIRSRDPRLKRHINHDPRAWKTDVEGLSVSDVEWKSKIGGLLDQGSMGSCTANAKTYCLSVQSWLMYLPQDVQDAIMASPSNQALFIQPFYSDEEKMDGGAGLPSEDEGSSGPTSSTLALKRKYIKGYTHIISTNPEDTAKALTVAPGSWGTLWKTGMDDVNATTGQVKYEGSTRGGHELALFKVVAALEQIWFWQSWGGWGYQGKGMGWISFDDFAKSMKDQGDVVFDTPAGDPVPTPAPTPVPVPADVDQAHAMALKAWEPNIISRLTKAGKVKATGDAWMSAHNL